MIKYNIVFDDKTVFNLESLNVQDLIDKYPNLKSVIDLKIFLINLSPGFHNIDGIYFIKANVIENLEEVIEKLNIEIKNEKKKELNQKMNKKPSFEEKRGKNFQKKTKGQTQ